MENIFTEYLINIVLVVGSIELVKKYFGKNLPGIVYAILHIFFCLIGAFLMEYQVFIDGFSVFIVVALISRFLLLMIFTHFLYRYVVRWFEKKAKGM